MKHIATLLLLSITLIMDAAGAPETVKADEQSQSAQNARAYDEFKRVDAVLTKVFEHRLTELEKSPALREALIASQRAFLAFREADGHYESVESEGGSARTYYVNARMTYLTEQRIYQLKTNFGQGWIKPVEPESK
jgi:uncharacterized protein YecT (DUF1311 family)